MDNISVASSPIVRRPYEDDTDNASSFNGESAPSVTHSYVTNSVTGPDISRRSSRPSGPSSSTGCRQRVTVVCGECKRLKLKCDRRAPCGSCQKRDTIPRCIYSQAAAEKVDVQSLNNRLLEVEARLRNSDKGGGESSPGESSSAGASSQAYLAVGPHGSSVAVNLHGAMGIWVDHLGLSQTLADSSVSSSEGFDLQPCPSMPDSGTIDFYSEHVPLFRLPNSLLHSPPPDAQASDGEEEDDDDDGEDEGSDAIGITPKLIMHALPRRHIRTEIYERLEQVHLMAPSTNIFVFKSRIEEMCQWAESRSTGIRKPVDQEAKPAPGPPTINFFAATAMALALGAECWAAEFPPPASNTGGSPSLSPFGAHPTSSRSMPPPPVPASASNATDGPTSPANSSASSSAQSLPRTSPQSTANLADNLYKIGRLALAMSIEGAGYAAFDTDYMVARCLQARFLLHSHRGLTTPSGGMGQLLKDLPFRARKRVRELKKRRNAQTSELAMSVEETPTEKTSQPRNARLDGGAALALAPELVGVVSDMVGNARLMGLNHDPDGPGGERLSLFDKEMRRRLWWEINIWDVFVAECLGESPMIADDFATTKLPADVDEESFGPDSANLPAPNIESDFGNIEYFVQRIKLVRLVKRLRRKLNAFRELHENPSSSQRHDMIETVTKEIRQHCDEMSDHLRLRELPNLNDTRSESRKTDDTTSPLGGVDSPHLVALRCETAISTRYMLIMSCLPFARPDLGKSISPFDCDIALPGKNDFLVLLEPAIMIVKIWKYINNVYRHIRPSFFLSYALPRQLFDTAIVLSHLAIEQPMYAAHALTSVRTAYEIISDRSVLTGRYGPSEAVRLIEELISKAESVHTGSPSIMKRKHEDIDGDQKSFLDEFRVPFVGAGVITFSRQARRRSPSITGRGLDPIVSKSASVNSSSDAAPASVRGPAKHSQAHSDSAKGDQRPTSKHKTSHPKVSIRSRAQAKPRDGQSQSSSTRARANSTTSGAAGLRPEPSQAPPQSSLSVGQPVITMKTESPSLLQPPALTPSASGPAPPEFQRLNPGYQSMPMSTYVSPSDSSGSGSGFPTGHYSASAATPGFATPLPGQYADASFPPKPQSHSRVEYGAMGPEGGGSSTEFSYARPDTGPYTEPTYESVIDSGMHHQSSEPQETRYVERNDSHQHYPTGFSAPPPMDSLNTSTHGNQYHSHWQNPSQPYQTWNGGYMQ